MKLLFCRLTPLFKSTLIAILVCLLFLLIQNAFAISTGTGAEELPLGSDAGDDLNVGGGKLVVEGDTGNIGVGDASPDAKLDVETGDVRVGTGTFDNASGVSDVYVTGNLEVDGAIFATIPLTGISDINTATAGSGRILVNNGTKFNSVALGGDVSVDSFGSATIADNSVDGTDIAVGSDAQGDILYYDGTDWTRLGAGTSGHFLKTQGAGANPTWAAASGSGATSLTGLSDVNSATQEAGRILVSDGNKFNSTNLINGSINVSGTTTVGQLQTTDASASGTNATALGREQGGAGGITASGSGAFASGHTLVALAGTPTIVSSNNGSFAAGASQSVSVATTITASNEGAFAFGLAQDGSITASGAGSIAMGYTGLGAAIQSSGTASVAIGQAVQATANNAFALGSSFTNATASTFAVGFSATPTLTVTASNVGIADTTPDAALDVETGDVRVGTGTFNNASGASDAYVTGNLEVDGAIFATIPLTGISDVNSSTQGAGRILVSDGSDFQSTTVTGDIAITSGGVVTVSDNSVDGTDIAIGSDTQGDILYYDGTDWTRLAAGTSGHFLKTQGAGANPTWAASSGGASSLTGLSDVNSATQGAGRILVSDGSDFQSTTVSGDVTITSGGVTDLGVGVVGANEIASSGVTAATYNAATLTVDADGRITAAASSSLTGLSDVNTATAGSGRILVNNGTKFNSVALGGDVSVDSFGSATIADNSVDGTDIAVGSDAQGDILYYDGTDWTRLGAGTSGHFLKTQGAGANPTWAASSGGASSLTGLSDVNSATQGNGRLLVSDGNKFNSVSLLTVDYANGNVGIGSTAPGARLDISGSARNLPIALTDAASVATNAALGNYFTLVPTQDFTLANPTNALHGQKIIWRIKQDGTGNRVITLGGDFRLGTDIAAVVLSTGANKVDYLGAVYDSTDAKWDVVMFVKGY